MKTKALVIGALLGIIFSFSPLQANTINYGDLIGVRMKYLNLTETSMSTGDVAPLYGTPRLNGDSLIFTSMNFSSQSQNGASDITDGKLDGMIALKNSGVDYIDKIKLQEYGDVTLAGTGTSNTKASVANSLFVTVCEVDNAPLGFPEFIAINMVMSENGDWNLASDGAFTGKIWNGVLTLDLTATLAQRGINGHATLVTFSMDNTLATQSEIGTSAYIAKKAAGLQVTAEVIPEPATLFILSLGGLLLKRK
ncbi:MAG: hypothetical protein A2Y12_13265 [Planctomycetes bacterium GWF2_42_9]|nr:MAG: hypothetical protein A2Y12_13265 [Planctomycetes bacterium GWF2_42_9]HAL45924.1 hypothetical protein [Phycisphaerales bacterium]